MKRDFLLERDLIKSDLIALVMMRFFEVNALHRALSETGSDS